jgi:hypothetical protein
VTKRKKGFVTLTPDRQVVRFVLRLVGVPVGGQPGEVFQLGVDVPEVQGEEGAALAGKPFARRRFAPGGGQRRRTSAEAAAARRRRQLLRIDRRI